MRSKNLLFLLAVVLTAGLIAAGCGDDDSTRPRPPPRPRPRRPRPPRTRSDDRGQRPGSSEIDSEGVYNACVDAIEGTAAEAAGETAGAQARDAFEQCAAQAEALPEDNSARDDAIAICQDA